MTRRPWQDCALDRLAGVLGKDASARALVVVGSLAEHSAQVDEWSDLDAVLVVDDAAMARYWPTVGWLDCLGDVYTFSTSEEGGIGVVRVWYRDGRRVDVVVVPESAADEFAQQPGSPLRYGQRLLFARSPALAQALEAAGEGDAGPAASVLDSARLSTDFWFKGMLAVSKVARRDVLVALHLSLDMIRDCCVLGMALRDRDTGTRHHRKADIDDACVAALEGTRRPHSAAGILDSIERAATLFDELAARLADDYQPGRGPLLDFIARARQAVRDCPS